MLDAGSDSSCSRRGEPPPTTPPQQRLLSWTVRKKGIECWKDKNHTKQKTPTRFFQGLTLRGHYTTTPLTVTPSLNNINSRPVHRKQSRTNRFFRGCGKSKKNKKTKTKMSSFGVWPCTTYYTSVVPHRRLPWIAPHHFLPVDRPYGCRQYYAQTASTSKTLSQQQFWLNSWVRVRDIVGVAAFTSMRGSHEMLSLPYFAKIRMPMETNTNVGILLAICSYQL